MTAKPGYEAIVAKLQRQLEIAERELQQLHMDRLIDCIGAVTMPEPPDNKAEIARVETEIARLKADIAKHVWSLSTLASFFNSEN